MVQIISGFTEAALHRLPPLLCNPSSPWRTPGSHGSGGKRVRKYYFALHSCTLTWMNARAYEHTRGKNLQTYYWHVHVSLMYTHRHTHNGRI